MDTIIQFPTRPDMRDYRMPSITGIRSAEIGEAQVMDLSAWLAGRPHELVISYEDIAEAEKHNAEMWELHAKKLAHELAVTRDKLFHTRNNAVHWALMYREIADSEVTLGKVLGGIIKFFKGGKS